jgi:hypothetical protein
LKPYESIVSQLVRICQAITLPAVIITATYACKSPAINSHTKLLDSLLQVTSTLYARISSTDIQRLDDFYAGIEEDLNYLEGLSNHLPLAEQRLLDDYQILENQFGGCLRACGKFHEELYLVETNLQQVRLLLDKKQLNTASADDRIEEEEQLLGELNNRIDNAISLISAHVQDYYELKPGIDSIIARHKETTGKNE